MISNYLKLTFLALSLVVLPLSIQATTTSPSATPPPAKTLSSQDTLLNSYQKSHAASSLAPTKGQALKTKFDKRPLFAAKPKAAKATASTAAVPTTKAAATPTVGH